MFGDGQISFSKYVEKPRLVPGTTKGAHIKSAYTKILAIARSMGNKNFSSLRDLYLTVTAAHREAFLTPVKRSDGSIVQQLAKWTVLGNRYFLQSHRCRRRRAAFHDASWRPAHSKSRKTYNLKIAHSDRRLPQSKQIIPFGSSCCHAKDSSTARTTNKAERGARTFLCEGLRG